MRVRKPNGELHEDKGTEGIGGWTEDFLSSLLIGSFMEIDFHTI